MGTWKKAILEGDSTLVPSGGTTGQVLAKNSGTNYDTVWTTVSGSGGGTPAGNNGEIQFNSSSSFGADSSLFWDNTNKILGIGTTASIGGASLNTSKNASLQIFAQNTTTSSSTQGAIISVVSNDSAALINGDRMGAFEFRGSVTTGSSGNTLAASSIQSFATATFSTTSLGADLRFFTSTAGSNLQTERVRILPSGKVNIGSVTTDSGALEVNGLDTSANFAFRARNSAGNSLLQVRNDVKIGNRTIDNNVAVTIRGNSNLSSETTFRVSSDSGSYIFECRNDGAFSFRGGSTSVAQTGYTTFTNLTTDRTCDANATTVEELADILGTLIVDLKTKGIISA
jgi:hypothetical protein